MDGETFISVVNRGAIWNELPSDFIYVDGRENVNGMVVDSKMDYVPYPEVYYEQVYEERKDVDLFGEERTDFGAANRYII